MEQTSAHSDDVYSVGFSPDGMRIVSGSGDKRVKVWGERRFRSRGAIVCSWRRQELTCAAVEGVGVCLDVVLVARRRCFDAGAGERGDECPQLLGAVRELLARRHEDRVGL
eukprot:1202946-Prymnesium_polylepis.2